MKLLFILQYVPYPLDSGGNQATFNMIDRARHVYDVSVLFYLKSSKEEKAMYQLQGLWKNVTFYPFKPHSFSDDGMQQLVPNTISYRLLDAVRRSMIRKMNRRLQRFRAKKGLLQEDQFAGDDFVKENSCLNNDIPNFISGFHNYVYEISRKGFDLIQVEFYECLQLVYLLPADVIKVFVQHEIRFVRNRNELDLFIRKTADDEYRYTLRKELEMNALSKYDCIIALTEVDKQIMLAENPNLNIYVSPAIVSKDIPETIDFKPAKDYVFIGNGYHFPNADGLIWFCESVVPLLIEKKKMQTLYVVGDWNKEIKKRIEKVYPQVCFTGFVDDLTSFLLGKISIIPIRIGSGMRMKILDSVVAASPIVTTAKGGEGLPVVDKKNCLVADTPEDFSQALIQLTEDVGLQKEIVTYAHTEFSTIFDFKKQAQRRMELYAQYADSIKESKL